MEVSRLWWETSLWSPHVKAWQTSTQYWTVAAGSGVVVAILLLARWRTQLQRRPAYRILFVTPEADVSSSLPPTLNAPVAYPHLRPGSDRRSEQKVLVQELQERGHAIYFADWRFFSSESCSFSRVYDVIRRSYCLLDASVKREWQPADFDAVILWSQDDYLLTEKFRARYWTFLDALDGVHTINDARSIRMNMDKLFYLTMLKKNGVSVPESEALCVATDTDMEPLKAQLAEVGPLVAKPRFGEGGNGVIRLQCDKDLLALQAAMCGSGGESVEYLIQPLVNSYARGEKSLVFIGGVYLHAFRRVPAAGDFRANCWQGARLEMYEPTELEVEFGMNVIVVFQQQGYPMHYGRVDFLGGSGTGAEMVLMEAEFLDPTLSSKDMGDACLHRQSCRFATYICQTIQCHHASRGECA